jgi:hypothetical protein
MFGLALSSLIAIGACGGGGNGANDAPPAGTLELTLVDGDTSAALSNVHVIVIDGGTGESIDVLATDGNGKVTVQEPQQEPAQRRFDVTENHRHVLRLLAHTDSWMTA